MTKKFPAVARGYYYEVVNGFPDLTSIVWWTGEKKGAKYLREDFKKLAEDDQGWCTYYSGSALRALNEGLTGGWVTGPYSYEEVYLKASPVLRQMLDQWGRAPGDNA